MTRKEKNAGLIVGISLFVMALAAGFSYGFVQNEILADTAVITKQNILDNSHLFIAGVAGWAVIFITDLIVSFALIVFFKSTSNRISLLTAVIRVLYTLILGVAILQLISIIPSLSANEKAIAIMQSFNAFEKIWSAGLIIFGIHLMGLGYLSVKSQVVPRMMGYLPYFAGVGYIFVNSAKQLNYMEPTLLDLTESFLSLPMGLSEILLAIWLIYYGLKRTTQVEN